MTTKQRLIIEHKKTNTKTIESIIMIGLYIWLIYVGI